jgi:hypothetical protein
MNNGVDESTLFEKDNVIRTIQSASRSVRDLAQWARKSSNTLLLKCSLSLLGDISELTDRFLETGDISVALDALADVKKMLVKLQSRAIPCAEFDPTDANPSSSDAINISDKLSAIVNDIKSIERTFTFQRNAYLEKKIVSASLNINKDQLTYVLYLDNNKIC